MECSFKDDVLGKGAGFGRAGRPEKMFLNLDNAWDGVKARLQSRWRFDPSDDQV